jgi:hypothetical protein
VLLAVLLLPLAVLRRLPFSRSLEAPGVGRPVGLALQLARRAPRLWGGGRFWCKFSALKYYEGCEFCRRDQAARTAAQIAGAVAHRPASFPVLN